MGSMSGMPDENARHVNTWKAGRRTQAQHDSWVRNTPQASVDRRRSTPTVFMVCA